jgi:hypothetical protein
MKPSSKSPYEIRLELLQLAQIILSAKHVATCAARPFVDTYPTTEDIIAEADKLNGFVSKANVQH